MTGAPHPCRPALLELPPCRSPGPADLAEDLPSCHCRTDGTACGHYSACTCTAHLADEAPTTSATTAGAWAGAGCTGGPCHCRTVRTRPAGQSVQWTWDEVAADEERRRVADTRRAALLERLAWVGGSSE